ncbi:hypothetical protein Ae168Ps1_3696c [Pseudonocardia sp. Ae168_Ps1]|nr:hypothetical protein Ae150APs1_3673c [Pseudonocardia sp. Ae150A_Ps1]OLL81290.1 hypothetical protein Ae168Ps1_3696c [Pseudonocardia sp. Ae168_Ps1]OLL84597.1 hypothetical protein Ae263Ps1_1652 [Pseudonocardia sp. Ae263_Ps1]OLL95384.1 hypothetical protein Ae356Ps1_5281c [Pseudonocardia sp. Ae356_Ps1]
MSRAGKSVSREVKSACTIGSTLVDGRTPERVSV